MAYVEVIGGTPAQPRSRPEWFDAGTGKPLTDEQLIEREGMFPVKSNPPTFDPEKEKLIVDPVEEWSVKSDHVQKTYTVITKTVSVRREEMIDRVNVQYQKSLERGFTFDGGTFSAVGDKRHRVVELVVQQNAGRGMPRGKTSKRLRDKEGVAHDLTVSQIIDLAAAGSDHVEAADDNYEALMGQIQAATTHAELDAIDVTSGWPT